MEILGIIPARGNSKGLPKKNILKLMKKPLIEYTINAAKNSKLISRIITSTDNREISKIALSLGSECPFLRPKNLSKSNSSTLDVIKHTLNYLETKESYKPDIVLILQPTSPLRNTKTIDDSIKLLKKSHATSIVAVSKIKTHPYGSFSYNGKYLHSFYENSSKYFQRQQYPNLYYPTGSVYAFWLNTLKKYDSFYGPKIKPLIVNYENSIDVDELFDLFICEMKLQYWQNYKNSFSK